MGAFDLISGDAMWFMVALLYCYLIFWLLASFDLFTAAYKCLPVLLLLRIGMETYTNSFGADWHLSGNAIVDGLPIMLLGHYLAHRRTELLKYDWKQLVLPALVSLLLMFLSVNVKVFGLDISQIFKISTAALVFVLCLAKANILKPKGLIVIGQRYSTIIYLAHFMIGLLLKDAMLACGASDSVLGWCRPLAVILCSILFAALIDQMGQKKKMTA